MSFTLSESQQILQQQAQGFLADRHTLQITRSLLDQNNDVDSVGQLWREVAELGWTAAAIPETYDGFEPGDRELSVLAGEQGRTLCPLPFTSSAGCARAIHLFGDSGLQQRLLPALAAGTKRGTLAVKGIANNRSTPATTLPVVEEDLISGDLCAVPAANNVDFLVFPALKDGHLQLFLADLKQPGVELGEARGIDPSRPVFDLRLSKVQAELLSEFKPSATETLLDFYLCLLAHELTGLADSCLTIARDYALERSAFGRIIGSFQAIKHRLADMYVALELARSSCTFAAWSLEQATGGSKEAAQQLRLAAPAAFLAASQAANFCASENIQIHGGIGFSWEMDCHLYYRRAKALTVEALPPAHWKLVLANRLLANSLLTGRGR